MGRSEPTTEQSMCVAGTGEDASEEWWCFKSDDQFNGTAEHSTMFSQFLAIIPCISKLLRPMLSLRHNFPRAQTTSHFWRGEGESSMSF